MIFCALNFGIRIGSISCHSWSVPNEVVKVLDKKGKWIEVEYYHWLHEEYRTGWVLKKYLERVPANYSQAKTP